MSIDRHGMNRITDVGPLARCSFEEVNVVLIKAGVFAESDKVNGVSSNVMLGQIAPCRTGDCDILMDFPSSSGSGSGDAEAAAAEIDIENENELELDDGDAFTVPAPDFSIKRKVHVN
jgi:DNA-directed RNA polymerase beta' subunit